MGSWQANAGPSNVNRSLVDNNDGSMAYIHSHNRIIARIQRCGFLLYPVILVSGQLTRWELNACRLLRKKIIYLMHGNKRYEAKLNKLPVNKIDLESEEKLLEFSNKIVCVSERYSRWVKSQYPKYCDKITFVNNGLDIDVREKVEKKPYTIAVSGGNRIQKNNHIVCDAVNLLNSKGYNIKVHVFGRYYEGNANLDKYPFVIRMGHLEKEDYYKELDYISLYVIDSELESFGLVVGDAINCNCSLLMSETVGATSIMKVEDTDVVYDCHNIEELSSKILNILENANFDRLYRTIEIEKCSSKVAFSNIKEKCLN